MNVVSLFAGCGGLDRGFEKAGFNIIWANEFDPAITATYKLNHPRTMLDTTDIRKLYGPHIPGCDIIIGGPPCQAWSEGGMQRGMDDQRGQLFLYYISAVREKRPQAFLIENVRGILEEKHRKSLGMFLSQLESAGYNVVYKLMNAADYRIPQERYRVFFVGIRKGLNVTYNFPVPLQDSSVTLRQAIGDIVETPRFYNIGDHVTENPLRANHDVYTGPFDAKYMARNRVRSWNEVSFTIQAQARNEPIHPQAPKMTFISPSQRIFVRGQEGLYRRLSVRECARIQTFPDSFKFIYDKVEDGYKMVGNAVPPRLAYFLAMEMRRAFHF